MVSSSTAKPVCPDRRRGAGLLAVLRARLRLPGDRLSRLRQIILVINMALLAVLVQLANSSDLNGTSISVMTTAVLWLAWRWQLVIRHKDQAIPWDVAEAIAFGLVGVGLTSPLNLPGLLFLLLLYGALTFHALTLNARRIVVRTLCYLAAYSIVFLSMLDTIPDDQFARFSLLPIPGLLFLAVLGSLTARAFIGQSGMEAMRDQLDRTSSLMMMASDDEHVARAMVQGANGLFSRSIVSAAFIRSTNEQSRIIPPGGLESETRANPLPIERLPMVVRSQLENGNALALDGEDAEWFLQTARIEGVEGPTYATPIYSGQELAGLLITAAPRALEDFEFDALETLARNASLATERVLGLQDLQWREESYRSLVHNSLDAIVVLAEDATLYYETPAFATLRGGLPSGAGQRFTDLVHPEDAPAVTSALNEIIDHADAHVTFECRIRGAKDKWIATEVRAHNRLSDSTVCGVVMSCRDIGERKKFEERLIHQAYHDPLTELPNRSRFLSHLNNAVGSAARTPNLVAVLFLDLDRFKVVNDSLGHDAGDRLLQAAAERLLECVRPSDIVARLGGDEFAILLEDLSSEAIAVRIAQRIITMLQAPVTIGGQGIYTSTSIGIAIAQAGSIHPEELLHRADAAMYDAKREGKGRYRIYDPSMVADALEMLRLETELHEAIETGSLEIHYQPLISLTTGAIYEFEALVRWPHSEHGLLLPGAFVPLAEETGQIIPLDTWTLDEVCRQMHERRSALAGSQSLYAVSVNLSPLQFQQPRLAEEITATLKRWSISPGLLKLEITESAMMSDEQQAIETIRMLRDAGVKIAIDDFGVGYSSLSALRRFPIDSLKIDRSFVAGLGNDLNDTALVQAMITYGRTVGMTVVAEGIETEDQLEHLRLLGCDVGQGFFLAKPSPSLDVPRLIPFPAVAAPETPSTAARRA